MLSDPALDAHLIRVLELLRHSVEVHMRLHGAVEITLAELAFTCRDLLDWDDAQTCELLAGLSETSTEPSRAWPPSPRLANERPTLRRHLIQRAPAVVVLAQDEQFARAFDDFLLHTWLPSAALRGGREESRRATGSGPRSHCRSARRRLQPHPYRRGARSPPGGQRPPRRAPADLGEDRDRFEPGALPGRAGVPRPRGQRVLHRQRSARAGPSCRAGDRPPPRKSPPIELGDDLFHLEPEEATAALGTGPNGTTSSPGPRANAPGC